MDRSHLVNVHWVCALAVVLDKVTHADEQLVADQAAALCDGRRDRLWRADVCTFPTSSHELVQDSRDSKAIDAHISMRMAWHTVSLRVKSPDSGRKAFGVCTSMSRSSRAWWLS